MNIGLDALHWIIFSGWNLLQCRRMDNVVYPTHRLPETFAVTHIPDKVTHTGFIKLLLHLKLFQLISGVDDNLLRLVTIQQGSGVFLAKRARPSGDQYRCIVKHYSVIPVVIILKGV